MDRLNIPISELRTGDLVMAFIPVTVQMTTSDDPKDAKKIPPIYHVSFWLDKREAYRVKLEKTSEGLVTVLRETTLKPTE